MNDCAGHDESPFQSAPWFDHLAQAGFVQGVQPWSVPLGEASHSGALPLMWEGARQTVSSLSNYYSGLFGPCAPTTPNTPAPPPAGHRWREAVRCVRLDRSPARWVLQPLDAQAGWVAGLETALRQEGYWTTRRFCFANWFQPVDAGGFDAYWQRRPSALRNTVARARKRLERQDAWRLDIVTGSQPGLEEAIDAFVSVYQRSWKEPEPNPDFMPGLIRLAAGQGWLRLGLVHLGGEPVAAQVWLVAGGKAHIFKLAYVQGREKLSVGSVLTAALMRHVMDVDRVREVDFLSGDDAYKADWMAQRRERITLLAFDQRQWRGWVLAARHVLGRWRQALRPAP